MKRHKFFILCFCIAIFLPIFLYGCKTFNTETKQKKASRVLILDLQMPLYVDTEHTLRGWWLGSRDVFSSSSSGRIFSDYLAKELSAREVNIYSRIDQRYFLLDKEDEIKKAYPGLSDEEVDLYIKRANPIDFGKVLQTDYVVSGRIVRCETIHNRAFHWWRTKAEISIELYDVSKNMKISSIEIKQSNLFYSSSRMLQLLARKSSEQIMRNIK